MKNSVSGLRLLSLTLTASLLMAGSVVVAQTQVSEEIAAALAEMAPGSPTPADGQFVHIPPTLDDLEASDLDPELKKVILRGHDLFTNTQQVRERYSLNDMNCSSCHMGDGRLPFAAPIWPAAVILPNYRPKNDQVNSLEERIAGCFSYSMNGQPPAYGSDDMLALTAYHQWLARGVPVYQPGDSMYGRGFGTVAEPPQTPDYHRGKATYEAKCATCHAEDGSGLSVRGEIVFPPLWGDYSYNWGAGISRLSSLAGFVKHNMPIGQPNSLTDQEAWDLAQYINSQERPQDPRYTGDVKETRKLYEETFHKHTLYGREVEGRLLGDHDNVGANKDFLKPEALRPRTFD